MKYKILTIIIAVVLFNFCVADFAHAGWTEGKYNSAIDFNGTTTYIDGFGAIGDIKTVCFWVKASDITDHTDYVVDLNGTDYIQIINGEVTVNNISSPTYYVNAVSGEQTISDTTGWFHIAVTTDTNVDASAVVIGEADGSFFDGKLDEVKIYAYARSATEILLDYNAGVATHLGPSGKTCSEDPAGCMDYGLVGSWGMDEGAGLTAYDSSDNSNDGTLTNGPKWTTDSSPLAGGGGSLKFDGVDDYVDAGDDDSLDVTDEITVTAWIRPISKGSDGFSRIVSKGVAYGIFISNSVHAIKFLVYNSVTGYNNPIISNCYSMNNWTFIAMTSNATTFTTYCNDVATTEAKVGTGIKSSVTPVIIGLEGGSTSYFNGSIDSVRIYNRALSAEEVRYHYNKGGPVAEWKFDEGEGTIAYDSTSNNNDGTLTNFDWTATSGWGEGKYGSGLEFDGVDDYVDCGNDASLNIVGKGITVSAWVNPVTVASEQAIASRYEYSANKRQYYLLLLPNGVIQFRIGILNGTSARLATSANYTISPGIHSLLTGVYDGQNLIVYLNGVEKANTSLNTDILQFSQNTGIGRLLNTPVEAFFNGSIDSVRIYNYARTEEQIRMDYNAGVGTHFR